MPVVPTIPCARTLLVVLGAALLIGCGDGQPTQVTRPPSTAPSFRWDGLSLADTGLPRPAPFDLTASDGSGLRLRAIEARAVIDGPLALTELHLTFENPRPKVMEGRFRIALPEGAAVSRFAMKNEVWLEGEVVPRQAARQVYEDILHRRQDPALLEQGVGNEFSARVFPIPGGASKELIVSWSQPLVDGAYRLPLVGLPQVETLWVRAQVIGPDGTGSRSVEERHDGWLPDRDFDLPGSASGGRLGLRAAELVVLRATPRIEATQDEIAGLLVLVDSSASRGLGLDADVALVGRLLDGLARGAGPETPVTVAAFDQDVVPVWDGPVSGFGADQRRGLVERGALGASDLGRALRWVAERKGERRPRVLLVTDGVATLGDRGGSALREAVGALGAVGVERLDVIAVGGLRDDKALTALVSAGLAHDGRVIDGRLSAERIAAILTQTTRSSLPISVEGAEWSWPPRLDGAQPGDSVLVFASMRASSGPVVIQVGDERIEIPPDRLAAAARPLVERACAAARIGRLQEQAEQADPDLRRAIERQIVEFAVAQRIVTPLTSMLVLEGEWDYSRYGIDRNALAGILTVGDRGVEVVRTRTWERLASRGRMMPVVPPPVAVRERPDDRVAQDGTGEEDRGGLSPRPEGASGGMGARNKDSGSEAKADRMSQPRDDAPAVAQEPPVESAEAEAAPPPAPAAAALQKSATGVGRSSGDLDSPLAPSAISSQGVVHITRPDDPERPDPLMTPPTERSRRIAPRPPPPPPDPRPNDPQAPQHPQYTGRFAVVMDHIAGGDGKGALLEASAWVRAAPTDILAYVALGEAFEQADDASEAARAYGSLIDLFPSRADLRRYAGERLERLRTPRALEIAIDTFGVAAADRPDHPASHRLLAFALLRAGRHAEAWDALVRGTRQQYPAGRFAGVTEVLREDLGLVASAWIHAEPSRRDELMRRLAEEGGTLEVGPSLRFVLVWETDENDVDFHVWDGRGGHAYYRNKTLASGGRLYADVNTGYGPECFTVREALADRAGPYRLRAQYARQGPMGFGMGKLEVIEHDGEGGLSFDERPFVAMEHGAWVELGQAR